MTSTHAMRGLALAVLLAASGAGVVPAAPAQQAPAQQPAPAAGRLTTHVLDTSSGKPGAGMRISFEAPQGEGWRVLKTDSHEFDVWTFGYTSPEE